MLDRSTGVLDERNALYRLVSRTLGRLDALEVNEDDATASMADVRDLRRWLDAEQDAILPYGRALIEGAVSEHG